MSNKVITYIALVYVGLLIIGCKGETKQQNQLKASTTIKTTLIRKTTTITTIGKISILKPTRKRLNRKSKVQTPRKRKYNRKFRKRRKKNKTSTTILTIEQWKKSIIELGYEIELMDWQLKVMDRETDKELEDVRNARNALINERRKLWEMLLLEDKDGTDEYSKPIRKLKHNK